jgi:hypothetical protein
MQHTKFFATLAAVGLFASGSAFAAVVSGFDSNTLPRVEDVSAGPVDIGFTVDFGGNYNQLYVNDNGNVTFGSSLVRWASLPSVTNKPIIAAFFADVDTTAGGREVTYGQGTYNGRSAFGVNWVDVAGYYATPSTDYNSFQLILVDRSDTGAGNFDIVFNYDSINWEAGGSSYGVSAGVGFTDQTGRPGYNGLLDGSGTAGSFLAGGAFDLAAGSQDSGGIAGRYVFAVRAVPEPETYAMLLAGLGIVGFVARRRRKA